MTTRARALLAALGCSILVIALALGACSKSKKGSDSASTAEGSEDTAGDTKPDTKSASGPLIDRLRAQAKAGTDRAQAVAFALTDQGLVAATRSGVLEVLAPDDDPAGAVERGHYSAADELLFFVRGEQLMVLDLRLDDARPRALIDALPEDTAVIIARADRPSVRIGSGDNVYVRLTWSGKPTLEAGAENPDLADEQELAAAAQTRFADGAAEWLLAEAGRARTDIPARAESTRLEGDLAAAFEDCDDCLDAVPFGASAWQLFVAESECEDFCRRSCLLFDPATGQVASPAPTPEWVPADDGPDTGSCTYHVDKSGKSYAADNDAELCTIGAECTDLGGDIIGFLDPGVPIEL